MTTPQPPELPAISIDDLLRMIGDREVTIIRQSTLIASLLERIKAEDDNETSS